MTITRETLQKKPVFPDETEHLSGLNSVLVQTGLDNATLSFVEVKSTT